MQILSVWFTFCRVDQVIRATRWVTFSFSNMLISSIQAWRKQEDVTLCLVFQGERGDCGTPGEKGDSVWTLLREHYFHHYSQSLSSYWIKCHFCRDQRDLQASEDPKEKRYSTDRCLLLMNDSSNERGLLILNPTNNSIYSMGEKKSLLTLYGSMFYEEQWVSVLSHAIEVLVTTCVQTESSQQISGGSQWSSVQTFIHSCIHGPVEDESNQAVTSGAERLSHAPPLCPFLD